MNDEQKKRGYPAPYGWLTDDARHALFDDVTTPHDERIMLAAISQLTEGRPRLREVLLSPTGFQQAARRLNTHIKISRVGEDDERAEMVVMTAAGGVRIIADKDCPRDVIMPGPHKDWVLWADLKDLTVAQLEERREREIVLMEAAMDKTELTRKELATR